MPRLGFCAPLRIVLHKETTVGKVDAERHRILVLLVIRCWFPATLHSGRDDRRVGRGGPSRPCLPYAYSERCAQLSESFFLRFQIV